MTGPGFNPFRSLVRDVILLCLLCGVGGAVLCWLVMR